MIIFHASAGIELVLVISQEEHWMKKATEEGFNILCSNIIKASKISVPITSTESSSGFMEKSKVPKKF